MRLRRYLKKRQLVAPTPQLQAALDDLSSASDQDFISLLRTCDPALLVKADINAWSAVVDRIDELLGRACDSMPKTVVLGESTQDVDMEEIWVPAAVDLAALLEFSSRFMEEAYTRHLYNSCDHLASLLAYPDDKVVFAALYTLTQATRRASFYGRHHRCGAGATGNSQIQARLWELVQTRGDKEAQVTNLSFTLQQDGVKQAVQLNTEHFTQVQGETAADRFTRLVDVHRIPANLHFVLATLVRRSCSSDVAANLAIHCLALSVLVESSPSDQTFVDSIFLHCPQLIKDCFALVAPLEGAGSVSKEVQMAATYALISLNQERSKHSLIVASAGISEVDGVLPRAVKLLAKQTIEILDTPDSSEWQLHLSLLQATLWLLSTLTVSRTSTLALLNSGTILALIPLVDTVHWRLFPVTAQVADIFERILEGQDSSSGALIDKGILTNVCDRIAVEVKQVQSNLAELPADPVQSASRETLRALMTPLRRRLVKGLMHVIALSLQCTSGSRHVRILASGSVPTLLKEIIQNPQVYGGSCFAGSVSILADIVHAEPSTLATVNDSGCPDALIDAIAAPGGVLPSAGAIQALPSAIGAICLSPEGTKKIQDKECLPKLLTSILTSMRSHHSIFRAETASILGQSLDELMRHVPQLRESGIKGLVAMIEQLHHIQDGNGVEEPEGSKQVTLQNAKQMRFSLDESVTPFLELQEGASARPVQPASIYHCINFVAKMLESILVNKEHCTMFVKIDGLTKLLSLLEMDALPLLFSRLQAAYTVNTCVRSVAAYGDTAQVLAQIFQQVSPHLLKDQQSQDELSNKISQLHLLVVSSNSDKLMPVPLSEVQRSLRLNLTSLCKTKGNAVTTGLKAAAKSFISFKLDHQELTAAVEKALGMSVDVLTQNSVCEAQVDRVLRHEPTLHTLCCVENFVALLTLLIRSSSAPDSTPSYEMEMYSTLASLEQRVRWQVVKPRPDAPDQKGFNDATVAHLCSERVHRNLSHFLSTVKSLYCELAKQMSLRERRQSVTPALTFVQWQLMCGLSEGILGQLEWLPQGAQHYGQHHVAYIVEVVQLLDGVLLDERHQSLNLLMLYSMFKQAGIQKLIGVVLTLLNTVGSADEAHDTTCKKAVERIAKLLSRVAIRPVVGGNIELLETKSQGSDRPFVLDTFLKQVRFQVLMGLHSVWTQPELLAKSPDALVATILGVYGIERTFQLPSGEKPTPKPKPKSNANASPAVDLASVDTLVDMGYSRDMAQVALQQAAVRARSQLDAAVEWLLHHPEEVAAAASAQVEAAAAEAEEAAKLDELSTALSMDEFEEDQACVEWLCDSNNEMVDQICALLDSTETLSFDIAEALQHMTSKAMPKADAANLQLLLTKRLEQRWSKEESVKSEPSVYFSNLAHVTLLLLHSSSGSSLGDLKAALSKSICCVAVRILNGWAATEATPSANSPPKVAGWVASLCLLLNELTAPSDKLVLKRIGGAPAEDPASDMLPATIAAFDTLRQSPPAVCKAALTTLARYIKNIVKSPDNRKYRSIKLDNSKFLEVCQVPGGRQLFTEIGYEPDPIDVNRLMLPLTVHLKQLDPLYTELARQIELCDTAVKNSSTPAVNDSSTPEVTKNAKTAEEAAAAEGEGAEGEEVPKSGLIIGDWALIAGDCLLSENDELQIVQLVHLLMTRCCSEMECVDASTLDAIMRLYTTAMQSAQSELLRQEAASTAASLLEIQRRLTAQNKDVLPTGAKVRLVIRSVVETPATVKSTMLAEIRAMVKLHHGGSMPLRTFLAAAQPLVQRDASSFVQAASKGLHLTRTATTVRTASVQLKTDEQAEDFPVSDDPISELVMHAVMKETALRCEMLNEVLVQNTDDKDAESYKKEQAHVQMLADSISLITDMMLGCPSLSNLLFKSTDQKDGSFIQFLLTECVPHTRLYAKEGKGESAKPSHSSITNNANMLITTISTSVTDLQPQLLQELTSFFHKMVSAGEVIKLRSAVDVLQPLLLHATTQSRSPHFNVTPFLKMFVNSEIVSTFAQLLSNLDYSLPGAVDLVNALLTPLETITRTANNLRASAHRAQAPQATLTSADDEHPNGQPADAGGEAMDRGEQARTLQRTDSDGDVAFTLQEARQQAMEQVQEAEGEMMMVDGEPVIMVDDDVGMGIMNQLQDVDDDDGVGMDLIDQMHDDIMEQSDGEDNDHGLATPPLSDADEDEDEDDEEDGDEDDDDVTEDEDDDGEEEEEEVDELEVEEEAEDLEPEEQDEEEIEEEEEEEPDEEGGFGGIQLDQMEMVGDDALSGEEGNDTEEAGEFDEGDENPMHHLRVIFGGGEIPPPPDQFIFQHDFPPGGQGDEDEEDAEPRIHAGAAAARALHLFEHYDQLLQMRHPGHSISLSSPHSFGMRIGGSGGGQANAPAAHPLLQRQAAAVPNAPTVHTRVVGRIDGRHLSNHPRGLRLSRGDGLGPEFRLSFMEAQDLNFISRAGQGPQRRWNEATGASANTAIIEEALLNMLSVSEQHSEREAAEPKPRESLGTLIAQGEEVMEAAAAATEAAIQAAVGATGISLADGPLPGPASALVAAALDAPPEEAAPPEEDAPPEEAAMDSELMAAIAMSMEVDEEEQPAPAPTHAERPTTEQAAAVEAAAVPDDAPGAVENASGAPAEGADDGIDPEFLAALPEEMRQEVLAQHRAAQQVEASAAPEGTAAANLDPEFLAALPPDIRAELVEQERRANVPPPTNVTGAEEMDPASFLATLPPDLREDVLLQSDDTVLSALPPQLASEARVLRDRERERQQMLSASHQLLLRRQSGHFARHHPAHHHHHQPAQPQRVKPMPKVELAISRASARAFLQLLYLAAPLSHKLLERLLLNASANSAALRRFIAATLVEVIGVASLKQADAVKSPRAMDSSASSLTASVMGNSFSCQTGKSDTIPAFVVRRALSLLLFLVRKDSRIAALLSGKPIINLEVKPGVLDVDVKATGLTDEAPTAAAEPGNKTDSRRPVSSLDMLLGLLSHFQYTSNSEHLSTLVRMVATVVEQGDQSALRGTGTAGTKPTSIDQIKWPVSSEQLQLVVKTLLEAECCESAHKGLQRLLRNVARTSGQKELALDGLCGGLDALGKELRQMVQQWVALGLGSPDKQMLLDSGQLHHAAHSERRLLRGLKAVTLLMVKDRRDKAKVGDGNGEAEAAAGEAEAAAGEDSAPEEMQVDGATAKGKAEVEGQVKMAAVGALWPLWELLSSFLCDVQGSFDGSWNEEAMIKCTVASRVLVLLEAFCVATGLQAELKIPSVVNEKSAVEVDGMPPPPGLERQSSMSAASVMMGSGLAQQSSSASVVDQPRAPGSLRVLLRHRKLLNAYIRQTPALLDNAFKLIRDSYPRMLDFDNKRVYFNNRLRRENKDMRRGQLTLRVKRSDVFTQSFQQLDYYEPQELKGRLMVQFEGEEAIDAGGVSREWFLILSREIFDLKYGLFVKSAEHVTYQPNFQLRKTSEYEISLKYFKFIGRVFGKAIYDAQLLDAHFTRSFYKHMLGVPVSVQDMAAFDPSYHQSLSWILENKVADLGMDLTFTIEEETFGVTETIELKEGGKDITVTDENKKEYVQLVVEQKLCKSIQPQIDQFLKGFHEVIPDYINIFNEQELELLISGLPDIDIDDLKRNTEYVGYTATSPVITNFWRAVESFTREELANLVQFCTGTAKVPLEGFVALEGMNGPQKFQIHKAYGDLDRLATAHTCFNQLDLPEYASYDQMVEKLKMAFMEANQGFGFV